MLKKWNLALIIGSWLLSIFGTFITRSGVISSVHSSPSRASDILPCVPDRSGWRVSPCTRTGCRCSRRGAARVDGEPRGELPVQQLLFIGSPSRCCGHAVPILSELVQGTKITVGPRSLISQHPARTGVARAHRHRTAHRLASGLGPEPAAPVRRPGTVGVFTALILLVAGMRDLYAVIAMALGGFVLGTVGQEFARGARARHRQYGRAMRWRSAGCWPATAGGTAATSCTRAS